jgi:hypothetical protein
MAEFVAARLELLSLLESFAGAGWERSARHAIFGRTTQLELAGFCASHDRTHLRQIRETLDVALRASV